MDLPVTDLPSARDDLVRRIADSAAEFGCFQVINHGVSCDVAERGEKECGGLFELALEKKEVMSRSSGIAFWIRGWWIRYQYFDEAGIVLIGKRSESD